MHDLVIRAPRAVTEAGEVACCVCVSWGVIASLEPYDADPDAVETVELGTDVVLLPGLVDAHVHVNEPGRTDWEGYASATRAAAAGGVTTVLDMPLNSIPPTVDVDSLERKRAAARGQCFVDVGFWGGAVPGGLDDIRDLHGAGVFGFKCFLLPSGVSEFPPLPADEVETAMRRIASFDGLLLVHAEDAGVVARAPDADGRTYRSFLRSRPKSAENFAIASLIEIARRNECRVHVLHLASAEALDMIGSAQRAGVSVTAETCPHYLTFDAEEIPDGATEFKCCPPIREAANRDALWAGLATGTIAYVASDHSPCPPELKLPETGDFAGAWGGIASLQLGLSAVWTEASGRGFDLCDVTRWLAQRPAESAGLRYKGRVAEGYAADLCAFAPDESWTVEATRLQHRHPVTPYAGRTLRGRVRRTWLGGRPVELDGQPRGRLLTRGED